MTPMTSIGQTEQLSVTAVRSDGSRQTVAGALVDWKSSDPAVATVEDGTATAVGRGNATITAAYENQVVETPVSVRISVREPGRVRVLYAMPSDREFRPDYSEVVSHVIVDLQSWYRRELGGLTFSLYEATPEQCRMSETSDFYVRGDAWDNIVTGVQHCAPVQHGSSEFVWVIYADVEEPCDELTELWAGGDGLTIITGDDRLEPRPAIFDKYKN